MARARRVLPVPGGPNSSTPLGILAPTARNFCGSARNSLISRSSSTASSAPATSAKVTFGMSLVTSFALLRPNCMMRLPPPFIWVSRNQNSPTSRTTGSSVSSSVEMMEPRGFSSLKPSGGGLASSRSTMSSPRWLT